MSWIQTERLTHVCFKSHLYETLFLSYCPAACHFSLSTPDVFVNRFHLLHDNRLYYERSDTFNLSPLLQRYLNFSRENAELFQEEVFLGTEIQNNKAEWCRFDKLLQTTYQSKSGIEVILTQAVIKNRFKYY